MINSMNVFSQDGATPTPDPSNIKRATFTWDSAVTGAVASPTGVQIDTLLGTLGTVGKTCAKARVYCYSVNFNPNFGAPGAGTNNAIILLSDIGASVVLAAYYDDGVLDPITTNGWRLTEAPTYNPAFPAVTEFPGGTGIYLIIANVAGGAYNLTGKIQIEVEYVEEA